MDSPKRTRWIIAAALAATALTLGMGTAAVAASAASVSPASSASGEPASSESAAAPSAVNDGSGARFASGTAVEISEDVDGDVFAAGQSVVVSGDVSGDVIAAAQTITITGTVEGNIRLAGQDVVIDGDVGRSGTVFAQNVTITGSVGEDLVGAAATVRIGGDVGRDVAVSVGRLAVGGTVGGDLTYVSDRDAAITGTVTGTVDRMAPPQPTEVEVSPIAVFFGWLLRALYALVALSLITVLAGLLVPRLLERVTDHLVPTPWRALLVGAVAVIAAPVVFLFLLVTIIGAPLALAGAAVWLVLTIASFVYASYYVGRLLLRGTQSPILRALIGGLLLITALQIPWLNVLVWLAMVCFGIGAQLLEFYRRRPWRPLPAPHPAPERAPHDSLVGA